VGTIARLLSLPVLLVQFAFLTWTIGWLLALPIVAVVAAITFRVYDGALGVKR
jgi:hypothetical protein